MPISSSLRSSTSLSTREMPCPSAVRLTIAACHETVSAAETMRGLAGGGYVRISVSDTGIGMDEPTLAKATEPFFTTKGPGKGTGLGLSMVHGFAAQSGGALTLSSQPGTGTTVDLWLPRAEPDGVTRGSPSTNAARKGCERTLVRFWWWMTTRW